MNNHRAIAAAVRFAAGLTVATLLTTGSPVLSAPPSSRLPVAVDVIRDSKMEFAVFAMPEVLWKCEDKRCIGSVDARPVAAMNACKGVARKMTQVVAFKVADRVFDDAQLLACNGGKAPAATQ